MRIYSYFTIYSFLFSLILLQNFSFAQKTSVISKSKTNNLTEYSILQTANDSILKPPKNKKKSDQFEKLKKQKRSGKMLNDDSIVIFDEKVATTKLPTDMNDQGYILRSDGVPDRNQVSFCLVL